MQRDRIDLIIQQLIEESRCSTCGGRLSLDRVLTKQRLVALIETRCARCARVAKTICFDREALRSLRGDVDPFGSSGPTVTTPSGAAQSPRPRSAPVSDADVARMARFLEDFDGDFARLFSGGGRR